MALKKPVKVKTLQDGHELWKYAGFTEADTADPIVRPGLSDVTVYCLMNSGATPRIDIVGTLELTPTTYAQLHDNGAAIIQFAQAAGVAEAAVVIENVTAIRPQFGLGTFNADVYFLLK